MSLKSSGRFLGWLNFCGYILDTLIIRAQSSCLHWLILVFPYAFFVHWSILVVSIDLFLLSKNCFSYNGVYKTLLLLSNCDVIVSQKCETKDDYLNACKKGWVGRRYSKSLDWLEIYSSIRKRHKERQNESMETTNLKNISKLQSLCIIEHAAKSWRAAKNWVPKNLTG